MAFELAPLPYPSDALEPHIDQQTMEIHHGKHHKTYIDNLNAAIAGTEWESKTIEEIITHLDQVPGEKKAAIQNNGGGHYNHTLFWGIMGPNKGARRRVSWRRRLTTPLAATRPSKSSSPTRQRAALAAAGRGSSSAKMAAYRSPARPTKTTR